MTNIIPPPTDLPDSPGIYLFYNAKKELVYVGKATSLKSRVASYWRVRPTSSRPIESMMHEVHTVKTQTTDSVLEAVILEANTIKKFQPKYNVIGKDNKSWNYIIFTKESYPKIKTLRQHDYVQMGEAGVSFIADIFGPYPGINMTATLKILRRIFRFSTCSAAQKRPCFYYQLGECLGVCTGEISVKDYRTRVITPLKLFLGGKKKRLITDLGRRMKMAAQHQNFEEAGRLRDQIEALTRIQDMAMINHSLVHESVASAEAALSTSNFPVSRIEGYDISNLGKTGVVGSMVVFDSENAIKSEYRKFKIKTVIGQSDVDSMAEVIERRFGHPEWPTPTLLLIDGGLPQVNRVEAVLQKLNLQIPIVGIAKGPKRQKNQFTFGKLSFDYKAGGVVHSRRDFVVWVNSHQNLLIRVRDEAHRFAVAYQRNLRKI